MGLEFQGSPVEVTTRQILIREYDLSKWLKENETLVADDLSIILKDNFDTVIEDVASVNAINSPSVAIKVDFTQEAILQGREYYLFITLTKTGRAEDGYVRYRTFRL